MPSSSSTSTEPPRHPIAPEAHARLAVLSAYLSLRDAARSVLLEHAPAVRSLRADSALTSDIRAALKDHGRHLVRAAEPRIRRSAALTAASAREQTPGDPDVDLTPEATRYTQAVIDRMDRDFDDTIECSMSKLLEWAADGELDEADLELMLDDCDRSGSVIPWLFLMFGWLFGQMIRRAQVSAGIEEFAWWTRDNKRTRPAHHALHAQVFRWDGAPPLAAAVSSNHEDCWPGDDYNCRCVPRPVLRAATAGGDEKQQPARAVVGG